MSDHALERELRGQYERWWASLPAHDSATLGEILTEDWTYIDQFGTVRNKIEYIELVRSAIGPDHSTVTIDLDARRFGDVAIASGRYDVRGVIDTHEVDIKLRFTSVWQLEGTQWRCHAQHTTEIRPAKW